MTPQELLALGLFVAVLVFLAMREIMCWYIKQNRIVALLTAIKGELRQMNGKTAEDPADKPKRLKN